jgi:uncharacterized protein (DUF4213/DUF364 family)
MKQFAVYEKLKDFLSEQAYSYNLINERVSIQGKVLSTEEAIGKPQRQDFPLVKGKERLVQAEFKGALGQAFTDSPDSFEGILKEFLEMPVETNFQRAAFTAVLNAVMRHLGMVDRTIHCKDDEPNECARKLVEYIKKRFSDPKIALVGFQPAILDFCRREFQVRVVDLNPENIGKEKYGVLVEDADLKTQEVIKWCSLLLVTGSTLTNGTIVNFLGLDKPVVFYGTTIAGASKILGLNRFCECAK